MKIDIGQARTRAKELVKAGRVAKLADAQREIARELGYASWPAMVHALEPPTAARVISEADRATRSRAGAARGGARPAQRSLGGAHARRCERDPRTHGDAGGPLGTPPLFYVARSRIARDAAAAARDLLGRGADPNGPGDDAVDEPVHRLLSRRRTARTAPARARRRAERQRLAVPLRREPGRRVYPAPARARGDASSARTRSGTRSTTTASSECGCCSNTAAIRTRQHTGRRCTMPWPAAGHRSSCASSLHTAPTPRPAIAPGGRPTSTRSAADARTSRRRCSSSAPRATSPMPTARCTRSRPGAPRDEVSCSTTTPVTC